MCESALYNTSVRRTDLTQTVISLDVAQPAAHCPVSILPRRKPSAHGQLQQFCYHDCTHTNKTFIQDLLNFKLAHIFYDKFPPQTVLFWRALPSNIFIQLLTFPPAPYSFSCVRRTDSLIVSVTFFGVTDPSMRSALFAWHLKNPPVHEAPLAPLRRENTFFVNFTSPSNSQLVPETILPSTCSSYRDPVQSIDQASLALSTSQGTLPCTDVLASFQAFWKSLILRILYTKLAKNLFPLQQRPQFRQEHAPATSSQMLLSPHLRHSLSFFPRTHFAYPLLVSFYFLLP